MVSRTMRVTAVLLLSALAVADEPDASKETRPITTNLENVGPETAAKMLKEAAGLRVEFAPQAAEWKANLRLIGVPTSIAMKSVAEAFHCEARFRGKKRWHVAPKWQFTILDALEQSAGRVERIDRQSIDGVLETIRKGAGVDITLDKTVDRALVVSVPAKTRTYGGLLDYVAKQAKLEWELRYGVVYVAGKKRLEELPVLVPQLRSGELRDRRLKLVLEATPLKEVGAAVGVELAVPDEHADRAITARATDITLPQALALMLYPEGLTVAEAEGTLTVQPLPQR